MKEKNEASNSDAKNNLNQSKNNRYDDVLEDSVSLDDFGKDGKLKQNVQTKIDIDNEFEIDFDENINLNVKNKSAIESNK